MAGELTIDEKLNMTLSALKNLRTQLFELELQGLANTAAFTQNKDARKAQVEKEGAIKLAILQLDQKYGELAKLKEATLVQSNPSSPSDQDPAPEQSSGQSETDLPQPHSLSQPSEVP